MHVCIQLSLLRAVIDSAGFFYIMKQLFSSVFSYELLKDALNS